MSTEAHLEALAATEAETPASFLTSLGNMLREKEGLDVDLAGILARHLLTTTPAAEAVARAKDAIVQLASERAAVKRRLGDA